MHIDLQNLPPEIISCNDDNQIRLFALQLGISERFNLDPQTKDDNVFLYTVDDHKSHWLVFVLFWGFSNIADNGYLFYAYPKCKFSAQAAEKEFRMIARELNLNVSQELKFDGAPKPQN